MAYDRDSDRKKSVKFRIALFARSEQKAHVYAIAVLSKDERVGEPAQNQVEWDTSEHQLIMAELCPRC